MNKIASITFLTVYLIIFHVGCKKNKILIPEEIEPQLEMLDPEIIIEQHLLLGPILKVSLNKEILNNKLLDWSSLNEKVATVDQNGRVLGLWVGETEIIAQSRDGQGEARCKVKVIDHKPYKFRITLKDKGASNYSIQKPLEFLTQKSINRRKKHGISISEEDLPISKEYLTLIKNLGCEIISTSKWLRTVVAQCNQVQDMEKIRKLNFVDVVIPVWVQYGNTANEPVKNTISASSIWKSVISYPFDKESYQDSWNHLVFNNAGILHELGYKGNGISIAVIDGGYSNLYKNALFSNSKIMEVKSFIHEFPDPYTLNEHGVNVAGLMAANKPNVYIGTAPEAEYWLFSTDHHQSEFRVEEDYLVSALEYADSVGVDLVNISLSYDIFDANMGGYTFDDMDGKTAFTSKATLKAFERGMIIVSSAGNKSSWVSAPSDAPSVLTVGSGNKDGSISLFSSYGFTKDNRIKPEVIGLGNSPDLIEADGTISKNRYGTSFSTPIITGLVACLWQAYPTLSNKEIFQVMIKSSNHYSSPILPNGYGIPNMENALILAKEIAAKK